VQNGERWSRKQKLKNVPERRFPPEKGEEKGEGKSAERGGVREIIPIFGFRAEG